jgi:hypothetical protein
MKNNRKLREVFHMISKPNFKIEMDGISFQEKGRNESVVRNGISLGCCNKIP